MAINSIHASRNSDFQTSTATSIFISNCLVLNVRIYLFSGLTGYLLISVNNRLRRIIIAWFHVAPISFVLKILLDLAVGALCVIKRELSHRKHAVP